MNENFIAVHALADVLRTSLGPNARNKLVVKPDQSFVIAKNLQFFSIIVSKDGACIMKELQVQNPLAMLVVQSCQTLEQQIGDGTTSCAVLISEFL